MTIYPVQYYNTFLIALTDSGQQILLLRGVKMDNDLRKYRFFQIKPSKFQNNSKNFMGE